MERCRTRVTVCNYDPRMKAGKGDDLIYCVLMSKSNMVHTLLAILEKPI